MTRVFSVISALLALGFMAAPDVAKAQSSGAPTGCPAVGCNPYFDTNFPPATWPVMSWLDEYSPSVAPPGNGCIPDSGFTCQRGQGVITSRYSPLIDYRVMSTRVYYAAVNGSGSVMGGVFAGSGIGGAPSPTTAFVGGISSWPGNELFPASDYELDCGQDPAFLMATWGFAGSTARAYSCKMTKAPVMDMSEIQTKLEAQGYVWYLSYPFKDTGTGHAVVTFAKYGASCPAPSIAPPVWWTMPQNVPSRTYRNLSTGQAGAWPCKQGYARVTNAGWVNQFQPSPPICYTYGYTNGVYGCIYKNYQNGDYLGQYFATLPEDSKANALRLVLPKGAAVAANVGAAAGVYLVPIIDLWVSTPGPAAELPPIPEYVPPANPTPVNVGDTSTGAGAGSGTGGSTTDRNDVPFDYNSFCNAPGPDGQPRSPLWIESCLGGTVH